MNTKLTLNVDKSVVESAKKYAKKHGISLSNLIENYLNSLNKESQDKVGISGLVESLTGVIPEVKEEGEDYREHLVEKYM